MALNMLKSGKQILRLAAKSQKQLGISPKSSLFVLTNYSHRCLGGATTTTTRDFSTFQHNNNMEVELSTALKGFLRKLFNSKKTPGGIMNDLVTKLIKKVEKHELHPEEDLYADMEPLMIEVLDNLTDVDVAELLCAFARKASPSAAPSNHLLDKTLQGLADAFPSSLTDLLQDLMINMFMAKYQPIFNQGPYFDFMFDSDGMHVNINVPHLVKENLKVFIVDDLLIVTGTAADAPTRAQSVKQIIEMPEFSYDHNKVTGSIVHEGRQLKIVFPGYFGDDKEVKKPRFYQVNLI